MSNTSSGGLRHALIGLRERSLKRWPPPHGEADVVLEALRAGDPVQVSSEAVMGALIAMRLPCDDYAHGGRYFQTMFVLDEGDELREWTG